MNRNGFSKRNISRNNYRGMSASAAASSAKYGRNVKPKHYYNTMRAKTLERENPAMARRLNEQAARMAAEAENAAEWRAAYNRAAQEAQARAAFVEEMRRRQAANATRKAPNNKRNLYKNLGVNRKANAATIRRAYHRRALQSHPDKGGNAEEFRRIQAAYEILSNKNRRIAYNMELTGNISGF